MCGICGCGDANHTHDHAEHEHHGHDHTHAHNHHHGAEHAHVPGLSPARRVQVEQAIFQANDQYAASNRQHLKQLRTLALNLVSSPGSGKTTLLTETISRLNGQMEIAVIEGDQQTERDAERIRATGVKALQINTGKGCHLDAHQVGHAMEHLQLQAGSVLFIENVGNLVCPSAFDLGEAHKVVILSVTEGEDKPLKYPNMFHAADLMLLNKVDLLPYLDFDVEQCLNFARQVNPKIKVILISAKTGEGFELWLSWLHSERALQSIDYA